MQEPLSNHYLAIETDPKSNKRKSISAQLKEGESTKSIEATGKIRKRFSGRQIQFWLLDSPDPGVPDASRMRPVWVSLPGVFYVKTEGVMS